MFFPSPEGKGSLWTRMLVYSEWAYGFTPRAKIRALSDTRRESHHIHVFQQYSGMLH